MSESEQPGGDNGGHDEEQAQQANGEAAYFADLPLGEAWGESITKERAAELEAKLRTWMREAEHGELEGPFDGYFLNGADVFWVAERTYVHVRKLLISRSPLHRLTYALHRTRVSLARIKMDHSGQPQAQLASVFDQSSSAINLSGAILAGARLTEARLKRANLSGATLFAADLSGTNLTGANLSGAYLNRVALDNRTDLSNMVLSDTPHWYTALMKRLRHERAHGPVSLADVHWNDIDLTVLDWSGLRCLGDERSRHWWWRSRDESERAARANVQLAKRLRDAGMNDDADRFSYRAQVRQRGVHLLRFHLGRWLFSWLLFVIAGYGYRPLRTLFWYLAVIFGFAALYMTYGHINGQPFSFDEALVFSVTSFHGRGFFPGTLSLRDSVTKLAAVEAVFGLFIEVSFIATFTQRYFGK